MNIYLVVETITQTRGHGDFADVKTFATYYEDDTDKSYPAFVTREDAQKFIDSVTEYSKPEILELPIVNVMSFDEYQRGKP